MQASWWHFSEALCVLIRGEQLPHDCTQLKAFVQEAGKPERSLVFIKHPLCYAQG